MRLYVTKEEIVTKRQNEFFFRFDVPKTVAELKRIELQIIHK